MRTILYIVSFAFLLSTQVTFSQEWKNIRTYKKTTGIDTLQKGAWLKKDRRKNTDTWQHANAYNLSIENGNLNYKTIRQIRDFYLWFDAERKKQGHDIHTVGVVAIVAKQLSNFDSCFIRTFIVRNKEVVWFGNEGSKKVLAYAFPLLKKVYFSKDLIKGEDAKDWDLKYIKIEQCDIIEPIYKQLSAKAIKKLERIAKGKGIYTFGVKNQLKFKGDISNCKSRYGHALLKLYPYYLNNKHKTID